MRFIFSLFHVAIIAGLAAASVLAQAADERLRPFLLANSNYETFETAIEQTSSRLTEGGFRVIGDYAPYDKAHIIIFTSDALQTLAAKTELGGFGAVLRAAVTEVDGDLQVSYVNPYYMAKAYRLDGDITPIAEQLEKELGPVEPFGSKKGVKTKSLPKYRYMFTTERFNEIYELGEFADQSMALAKVTSNLAENNRGLAQVYQLTLPGDQGVLIGVAMAPLDEDDKYYNDVFQMSVVDIAPVRSTAYLPYEILISGGKVQALHMRFRMAVHFPDLSMMGKHSFMTLMPSPTAIEKALKTLAE